MRYPPEETAQRHEQILNAASKLFRERGFDGVSVAQVMEAAGLTHGGFYAHFPSKEHMAAAGVAHALDTTVSLADQANTTPDPRATLVDGYLTREHRDHADEGCALAALGPEVARRSGPVRRAFTEKFADLVDRMAAGSRRRDPRAARREALATASTLVGALILARAVDDEDLSDEVLTAARASLGVPAA